MASVLIRENLETDIYRENIIRKWEQRSELGFYRQKGMLKLASKSAEAKRDEWNKFFFANSEGTNQLYWQIDIGLLIFTIVKTKFCCLCHSVCGTVTTALAKKHDSDG